MAKTRWEGKGLLSQVTRLRSLGAGAQRTAHPASLARPAFVDHPGLPAQAAPPAVQGPFHISHSPRPKIPSLQTHLGGVKLLTDSTVVFAVYVCMVN